MNDESKLDPALRDRLNIVEIPSYTRNDMVQIIKRHTLPETLTDKGLGSDAISLTDDAINALLNHLADEIGNGGMRPVERAINDIVSKLNLANSLQYAPRSSSSNEDTLPLTFKLMDFHGFPYTVNVEAIHALCTRRKDASPNMYS